MQRCVDAILTSANRMHTMIRDLIDSARLEAGQLQPNRRPVDLGSFVLDLQDRLTDAVAAERIRAVVPPGLPPVLADPDLLERILMNLLTNALKYSAPDTAIAVTLAPSNAEVVTSVSDEGPGIPPEERCRLFQRYYRTRVGRKHHEGLGLGLQITKGLVEAQEGRIWVESEPGKGSPSTLACPSRST